MSETTMSEKVTVWSQDYSLLYTTEDREDAKRFFLDSGTDWLPIVIDYGTDWAQRWSGRIERTDSGGTEIHRGFEFLKYMLQVPTIDPGAAVGR